MKLQFICCVILLMFINLSVKAFQLKLEQYGPLVFGFDINFTGTLLHDDGSVAPNDNYYYTWSDNIGNENEQTSNIPYTNWTIKYNRTYLQNYEVKLVAEKKMFIGIPYQIGVISQRFQLSDSLNGKLILEQNGTERTTEYISTLTPVNHTIQLEKYDYDYLINKSTYITTYWFQNCTYMGQTNGLTYINLYGYENEVYDIEALVIGSFNILPEPTTTTTTTTTTTSTTTTTTTTSTTTTPKPTTSTTKQTSTAPTTTSTTKSKLKSELVRSKRDLMPVKNDSDLSVKDKKILIEISPNGTDFETVNAIVTASTANSSTASTNNSSLIIPGYINQSFTCFNKSMVAPDPKKLYGYYSKKIISKIPVSNVTISGKNWLQHGELLNIKLSCKGSGPFSYCIKVFTGPYNVTGNETCLNWLNLDECEVPFQHLISGATTVTVIYIVKNPITKIVNQVTVNFYEAKKQSQLSVIVVPVSFSLVAVILVVFGVAYYIQNRERFSVEVADFNFGDTQSVDMEYKTFRQRLFDSVREALRWPRRNSADASLGTSDDSSLRYGPMS